MGDGDSIAGQYRIAADQHSHLAAGVARLPDRAHVHGLEALIDDAVDSLAKN